MKDIRRVQSGFGKSEKIKCPKKLKSNENLVVG